jgi:hypothetical protein
MLILRKIILNKFRKILLILWKISYVIERKLED